MSVCGREKCALRRRSNPPGMHGGKGQKRTQIGFGIQLREKQKVRFMYGLMERQLAKYVMSAATHHGDTGKLLKVMLERRLDNAVYRAGFAKTRAQARQMVTHGHIAINGKKVDIPSYQVRADEVISVKENKRESKLLDGVRKELAVHQTPAWLALDAAQWGAAVVTLPSDQDIADLFDAKPIIEYYSR